VAEGEELIMESIESMRERHATRVQERIKYMQQAEEYQTRALIAAQGRDRNVMNLYCEAQAAAFKASALCAYTASSILRSIELTERLQVLEAGIAKRSE
jgi:hypothetical protein